MMCPKDAAVTSKEALRCQNCAMCSGASRLAALCGGERRAVPVGEARGEWGAARTFAEIKDRQSVHISVL